jgi:hypothetical protein
MHGAPAATAASNHPKSTAAVYRKDLHPTHGMLSLDVQMVRGKRIPKGLTESPPGLKLEL